MLHLEGDRTPEMRRGPDSQRARLTARNPRVETALASLEIDGFNVSETRAFGNRLAAEAERWMMRGGFGERGRISKADAHRVFRDAFGARPLNRLSRMARDGAE